MFLTTDQKIGVSVLKLRRCGEHKALTTVDLSLMLGTQRPVSGNPKQRPYRNGE
jgi:hypothetical protein